MIGLIDFLSAAGFSISTGKQKLKVHLACWTGEEDPLDLFLAGEFDEWQRIQNQRNFQCAHVLSLIAFGRESWLFAGVYRVDGCRDHPELSGRVQYDLTLEPGQEETIGRVVVHHRRASRTSYPWYDPAAHKFELIELLREKTTIAEFPGFKNICVSYARLKLITRLELPSWRGALEHAQGIYVITDTKGGKHYVGKADGKSGLWQRWVEYAATGHGGNKQLRRLLTEHGPDYAENFQFSIIEIVDAAASEAEVSRREEHWMRALDTRRHGLNGDSRDLGEVEGDT